MDRGRQGLDNQTDMRARFSTGKIGHSLVTGLALTYENNQRQNRSAPISPTTLLNPNPTTSIPEWSRLIRASAT